MCFIRTASQHDGHKGDPSRPLELGVIHQRRPPRTSGTYRTETSESRHILESGQQWTGWGVFGVRNAKYLLKIIGDGRPV